MSKCQYCSENIETKNQWINNELPDLKTIFCCWACYDLYFEGIKDEQRN